jgi:hypothetical protein
MHDMGGEKKGKKKKGGRRKGGEDSKTYQNLAQGPPHHARHIAVQRLGALHQRAGLPVR